MHDSPAFQDDSTAAETNGVSNRIPVEMVLMDNLHYRRTFDLNYKNEIPGKNFLKVVKFQNLVEKYCNVWKIWPYKVCKFSYYCVTCGNCYHFRLKNGNNFRT